MTFELGTLGRYPVLAVLGALLFFDGALLVGTGRINIGTVLPAFLGLLILAAVRYHQTISRWKQQRLFRLAWWGAIVAIAFWVVSLLVFVFLTISLLAETNDDDRNIAYVVILGAGLRNSAPSPTLEARLKTAIHLAERNPKLQLIVSGGQGFNESIPEASAMASYLKDHGIAPERIWLEDQSTSTWENLLNTKALVRSRGAGTEPPIGIVTSDFHAIRAQRIATHVGFRSVRIFPTPTPWWILPNSWLREYFATLSSLMLGEV